MPNTSSGLFSGHLFPDFSDQPFSFFLFCFASGGWTQGILTSELHPQPYFLFFIWKQGLTKLRRASLSSWGWPRTRILQSPPPKYWDYKHAPPCPAGNYTFWYMSGYQHHTCTHCTFSPPSNPTLFPPPSLPFMLWIVIESYRFVYVLHVL